jgi:hypothetical protein
MFEIYNEFIMLYRLLREKPIDHVCGFYVSTLANISEIIKYTYNNTFSSSDKETIIKVLYKMYKTFVSTRELMIDLENKSDYVKTVLKTAKENEGKVIEDKKSLDSQIYYCYRHMHHSCIEENANNFLTYEDGKYTYEEIYDYYYYGENLNANLDDREDIYYEKWFKDENNISHYCITPTGL